MCSVIHVLVHQGTPTGITAGAPRQEELECIVSPATLQGQAPKILVLRIVVEEVVCLVAVGTCSA
jgi:hypothetical protein